MQILMQIWQIQIECHVEEVTQISAKKVVSLMVLNGTVLEEVRLKIILTRIVEKITKEICLEMVELMKH